MSAAAGPDGPLKNMHCDGYERPPPTETIQFVRAVLVEVSMFPPIEYIFRTIAGSSRCRD